MIEDRFDIPFVAQLALREKQVQQAYRPIIGVHKWFARRPGTLFRGLLLAEYGEAPVRQSFTRSNRFENLRIADPFMGGGTPLIEANRLGCSVLGFDINPMSYWIVRQAIEHLDLRAYQAAADRLVAMLRREVGHLYQTRCMCGRLADAKYFLWVKQQVCPECATTFDLWPGYRLAKNARHPAHVVVCSRCGTLNERGDVQLLGECDACDARLVLEGNARRGKAHCSSCGCQSQYPIGDDGPPGHALRALEYHCACCRPGHRGRFFKRPDSEDLARSREAANRLAGMRCRFVPGDEIPVGDETNRLHRWGYRRYRELFSERQVLGLEIAARWIASMEDERVRHALATNLSDLLRYQNLLCRYDTMALKSLDIFSVHGFPISLIQCESNMLGIPGRGKVNIGSGGWSNIIAKFVKAKEYCDKPFETVRSGRAKRVIHTPGEWIGDRLNDTIEREVVLLAADSAQAELDPESLDGVFTDPPYFGMVQYAELMDFCYVWLRRLVGDGLPAFQAPTTRNSNELTGNRTAGRGLEHFSEGISRVFQAMARALRNGRPLVFTYHHNQLTAYSAIGIAILDAGLPCTATLPCPAEMGGSIHIANTGSSILDSVFVCRKGTKMEVVENPAAILARDLATDAARLMEAGYDATDGDLNCLLNGHACRLAINRLAPHWDPGVSIAAKLESFNEAAHSLVQDRAAVVDQVRQKNLAIQMRTPTEPLDLFEAVGVVA